MKSKPESSSHFSPKQKRTGSWISVSDAVSPQSARKSNSTTPSNLMKKELAIFETITLVLASIVGTILLTHAGLNFIEYLLF